MKKFISILLVLALSFALIGCAAPAAAPATEAAAPAAPAGEQAVPEIQGNTETVANANRADRDTMVVALQGELTTLDAQYPDDGNLRPISWSIYDTIFKLNGQTLEPELTFCESYTQPDDVTWEFKIKEGVVFHDGDTLDAEDCAFAINRQISPELNSQVLGSIDTIDHAEVIDDLNFRIVTKASDPLLPKRLTFIPIVSKSFTEAHDANELTLVANGTGPYKFVEWKTGDYLLITANENYYGEQPAIKNIKYRFIEERLTSLSAVQAGEVDLAVNMYPEYIPELPKVYTEVGYETYWVRFNQQKNADGSDISIMGNKDLRLAANYAVDLQGMSDALFQGFAAPCQGQMCREGYFGYVDSVKDYGYDVAKAQELIKNAGYNGEEIEFVSERGRWLKDGELTEAIGAQLMAAGFNVTTKFLSWQEWLDMLFDKVRTPDLQFSANSNDFFDVARPLDACVHSASTQSGVTNADYDAKIEEARAEIDTTKRQAMYDELITELHDDPFAIYMLTLSDIYGVATDLVWTPRRDSHLYMDEFSYAE